MIRSCTKSSWMFRTFHSRSSNSLLRRLATTNGTFRSLSSYEKAYKESIDNPEKFWARAAEDIVWLKPCTKVLDDSRSPFTQWFVGGQLNTCYNAVDHHVNSGRADQTAIIWDSPVSGNKKKISYKELQSQVAKFARVLVNNSVKKGDCVIIYMPMIPQALVAMLGCARIGAIHSVVFGGFAPHELARRLEDAKPKVVVTASCGIEPHKLLPYEPLVEEALGISQHQPNKVIVYEREQQPVRLVPGRDINWDEAMDDATPHDCVPVSSEDPLYILYTSGTTGKPKGIQRANGGHAVALKWSMENLYGVKAGETWWTGSDIGWVVGHSYCVYAPLLKGCTSVIFEGKPVGCPDAGTFFRVINEHDVSSFFVAPTALRAIKNEDPDGTLASKYPMKNFRALFVAGEHADNDILEWTSKITNVPVLDHWWQTETGWAITSHALGLDVQTDYPYGTTGLPSPGWNVQILNETNKECQTGEQGSITVKLPLPPGAMSTLWNDDERFVDSFFVQHKGYYCTHDGGVKDANGYVTVLGRMDDIINVAGHRLSTKQMERAIADHKDVTEQAVIPRHDKVKGSVPVGLVVLRKGFNSSEATLCKEVIQLVRNDVGPVASFHDVIVVPLLPKTRAGKVVRGILAKMLNREAYKIPQTVENPEDFELLEKIFTDINNR